jgi:transposase
VINGTKSRKRRPAIAFGWSSREFYDLGKNKTAPVAEEALRRIAALHAIEDTIRRRLPEVRRATRQARNRPLVTDLFTWLEQQLVRLPGGSPTAQAVRSTR